MLSIICPKCGCNKIILNGKTKHKKQNHKCKECNHSFVLNPEWRKIPDYTISTIKSLLAERVSLRGIARAVKVSISWLMNFVNDLYANQPKDLNAWFPPEEGLESPNLSIICQMDELWSFVGSKKNKAWVWLVIEEDTRQIVALHVGGRTTDDARKLWDEIPEVYKQLGYFYSDFLLAYQAVFSEEQHTACGKESGRTSYIERVNNTIRQRNSRLVRQALSFSRKMENHIESIRYFIRVYNMEIIEKYFKLTS